jgi:hypothetical protein
VTETEAFMADPVLSLLAATLVWGLFLGGLLLLLRGGRR